MLDKMSMQKRMMLATVFSLIFFVIYGMTIAPQAVPQTATEQATAKTAAPTVANTQSIQASATPVINNVDVQSVLTTIKSEDFELKIDTLGRIVSKKLLSDKYLSEEGNGLEVVNVTSSPLPLEIRFSDSKLNKESRNTAYTTTSETVNLKDNTGTLIVLTQKLSTTTVTKNLTFFADGHYDINVKLSNEADYFLSPGIRPNVDAEGFAVHGVLVETSNDILEIIEDGESNGQIVYKNARLLSAFDRYYASMFYSKSDDLTVVVAPSVDGEENPILFVQGTDDLVLSGYIGSKTSKDLEAIDPLLTDALEYGWFTFIAHPMFLLLQWLHDIVGNWGFAIILVTLISRMVLYPLSYKGMVSMQKMKAIAPQVKEVQKKHKGDPQKMNAATMALYKKHGANPLGGCLPLLLQIPIFFSIYRVLLNSVELQGADFMLWITDLSLMDPYYVLPVIMGATMYYQQKVTPTNFTDPMQEKIFKFLPLIFTLFFFTFPAGLVLYWAVNNVLTIAQQMIVNKKFAIAPAKNGASESKS